MKQDLIQDVHTDESSSNASYLTSLLTKTLLFSASEENSNYLIDWFEFLSSVEPLRHSIGGGLITHLLMKLLPDEIVKKAKKKSETLRSSPEDDHIVSNGNQGKLSERDYWCALYAGGTQIDDNALLWALEELKLREPDSTGTSPILYLTLSDSYLFLTETLTDEKIREHLLSQNGRQFTIPIYKGKDIPSYETLISLLPLEIIGCFLCMPNQRHNFSRWGKEFIENMCSILQDGETDLNHVEETQFVVNEEVLQKWAKQNMEVFKQLADQYLTVISHPSQYYGPLRNFTDTVFRLLLRFEPNMAIRYYRQWNAVNCMTQYEATNFLYQLWQVEFYKHPEHRQFRQELLEECQNDEEIMFMTIAALAGGGKEELWNLVTHEFLKSHYAKERNLGVSILPWFGTDDAVELLENLKSNDKSWWVRNHAAWAYEIAQQERSCREVYRETLQTRDLFRISAVFEQMIPALSPTAK